MKFDESMVQWHFAVWEWLLRSFGGAEALRQRGIVLPEKKFFPDTLTNDHEGVSRVFARVKQYMGISDWPCTLQPMNDHLQDAAQEVAVHTERSSSGPAGMFEWSEEGVIIHYSTRDTRDIASLVATLTHELCHYVLQTSKLTPPGGWGDHEYHTDIACSFMGFGVFQCNSAFNFQKWGAGGATAWTWSRQGYLPESEHAYGLALFCILTDTPPSQIVRFLNPTPSEYFTLALHDLQHREQEIHALLETPGGTAGLDRRAHFPDAPRGGPKEVQEGAPKLTLEEVQSLNFRDPQKEPLLKFYENLIDMQPGEEWHAKEFAALDLLPPQLRHVILVVRFDMLRQSQGLQGAVLVESPDMVPDSERMLRLTAEAFAAIGETKRSRLLQELVPAIAEHLRHLDEAERENRLDEFVSPLDRDEEWLEIGGSFVPELRQHVRDHAAAMVFPPQ